MRLDGKGKRLMYWHCYQDKGTVRVCLASLVEFWKLKKVCFPVKVVENYISHPPLGNTWRKIFPKHWEASRDMARIAGGLLEWSEQMITIFWQQTQSVPKSGLAQQKFGTSSMWKKCKPKIWPSMGLPRIWDYLKGPISSSFSVCGYNRPNFSGTGFEVTPTLTCEPPNYSHRQVKVTLPAYNRSVRNAYSKW